MGGGMGFSIGVSLGRGIGVWFLSFWLSFFFFSSSMVLSDAFKYQSLLEVVDNRGMGCFLLSSVY
jgi:hypothetical protein